MVLTFSSFQQNLFNTVDIKDVKKIAVALSGGADSMCLTFLLQEVCKTNNIEITALTVDHKLRSNSTREANQVFAYMQLHGIRHAILNWEHNNYLANNVQQKAREARYSLLLKYCKENNISHLFVAHNYDDQAESVMLNILRGSGIDGIAGIKRQTKLDDINILRPLLKFTRSQIINFLNAEKIIWFEDASNSNLKFDRVKVRQLLRQFDYNHNLVARLNLLSDNAQRAKSFLDSYVDKTFQNQCEIGDFGHISIKASYFFAQEEEIRLRLLNKIFRHVHNSVFIYPVRLESLKLLQNLLKQGGNNKFTLCKCQVLLRNGVIYFYKEGKFIEQEKVLIEGDNIWDGRYVINVKVNGFYVTKLTKEIWGQIKPKQYKHTIPSDIIFSTPVITSSDRNEYYWPFLNGMYSCSQDRFSTIIHVYKLAVQL
ncbi:tRNA(Ile)-lysidine synthase [Candidatus Bandiella woodruffii]|uniref:tRNA(Ile)-lysidine synthase n=1 Tax=Candidatus Bandiella euplotis TaxID=1664265 RepID=A0ABZ0UL03_9RICK|nr:tRNA(Ile)-lysidine synthase [Candidatus Bandiella woodruffii]